MPQASDTDSAGHSQIRVLVVEDNAPDVLLIAEALNEHGLTCDITHLRDGDQAIMAMKESGEAGGAAFRLLILDLNMPRVGGLEVLSRFRNLPGWREVPILVLTSSLSPEERAQAERLGADRYVRKPADLYEFLSSVGEAAKELLTTGRVRA